MKYANLTEGKIVPTLIKFAIPYFGVSILQSLYGTVDLYIVGQFSNTTGVSAVSGGSQIMGIITNMVLGFTTGGTLLLSQYVGARRYKEAAQTIGSLIYIAAAISLAVTAIMLVSSGVMIEWIHIPEEAVSYAYQYLTICVLGIPLIVGYNAVSGVFRGLGDSNTPLIYVGIACALNIILDLLFIAGFHMEVAGAAFATVLSQGVSFILSIVHMIKRGVGFEFHRKDIRLNWKKGKRIMIMGLPIAFQNSLINISFIILTAIINVVGLAASAAVGVADKLVGLTILPETAFSSAVAVITAQCIGARNQKRASQNLVASIGLSLCFAIPICLLVWFKGDILVGIFTKDAEVIAKGYAYLKTYSIDFLLVSFVFNINSYVSGCGKPVFPMAHSMITALLVRIPVAFYFSRSPEPNLFYIGLATPLATFTSLIICMVYLKYQKSKFRNLQECKK